MYSRNLAAGLSLLTAIIVWPGRAKAGLILDIDAIQPRFGAVPVVTLVPLFATGQAIAANPPGVVVTPMPPGGGTVTAAIGNAAGMPVAISTITANVAADTVSVNAVSTPPGNTVGTAVDITKAIVVLLVPVITGFDVILTVRVDPSEMVDAYLGPGDTGTISDNISVTNLATGALLFNSITMFSNTSPNIVNDNTGQITWMRSPGMFGGATGGQPNAFSNNRWVMSPSTMAEFTLPVNLNAGQGANIQLDFSETISGSVSGSSIYGFSSSTIPEPSTKALLGIGLLGLLIYEWRRRSVRCRSDNQ